MPVSGLLTITGGTASATCDINKAIKRQNYLDELDMDNSKYFIFR